MEKERELVENYRHLPDNKAEILLNPGRLTSQ